MEDPMSSSLAETCVCLPGACWILLSVASHLPSSSQIKPKLSKKWASQVKDAYEYTEWELRLLDSPNIDKYAEIVDDLGAYFSETDVPIFAVSLPIFPSAKHFSPRYGPIKPIFQGAGIPFFDLLDAFSSEYENNGSVLTWGINPANSHPGPW